MASTATGWWPRCAEAGWRGGGQPDAAVVAEVNGLAIDTLRLRAATGALAHLYAYAGFTLAQQQLSALVRRVEADDLTVDATGNVSANHVPVADTGVPGSVSAQVLAYQRQIGQVLDVATTIDTTAAKRLDASHDPPVTSLGAHPGLLRRARADHAHCHRAAADPGRRRVGPARHDVRDGAAVTPSGVP